MWRRHWPWPSGTGRRFILNRLCLFAINFCSLSARPGLKNSAAGTRSSEPSGARSSLVSSVLIWMGSLQVKIIADNVKSEQSGIQTQLAHQPNSSRSSANKTNLDGITDKLGALNRNGHQSFPGGGVCSMPIQHSTVAGIQLIRLRTDQAFEETPPDKTHR